MLLKPLSNIKGIGGKKAQLLARLNLYTMRDVLFFMPRDYENFANIVPCAALKEGTACVMVRFASEANVFYKSKNMSIVTAHAHDETGKVRIVWYNQPYFKQKVIPGQNVLIYGKVSQKNRIYVFENPSIETIDNLGEHAPSPRGILPIYPLTTGIGQKTMRSVVQICLKECIGSIQETLPEKLREKYGLCEINYAIENIHYPNTMEDLEHAQKRLASEELFYFLLAVASLKQRRLDKKGILFQIENTEQAYLEKLSFELTGGQRKVLAEIAKDMSSENPMNRLVQGDVGSGKTVLAFYAMWIAFQNGYQSVLLSPTELLARQHVKNAQKIFGDGVSIGLLVGGMRKKERDQLCEQIASGEIKMIIATHAVLQSDIVFKNLGLIVTDEQHRFGVKQRAALNQDTEIEADTLVMSATPIPRTLSLMLYGDLDLSILDELPPNRKPISTHYVSAKKRNDLYQYVAQEASQGNQTYIVCPLVEEGDDTKRKSAEALYQELSQTVLVSTPVALLHGRMKSDEKTAILEQFRNGEIQVLVSTTVIEVGVDVPQATIMIVEDAERFGLAQLHQLRGRVGRGKEQSYCFLLSGSLTEDAKERIKIMCQTNDGFLLAQKDLEMRGPGEFLGTRQSGAGNFKMIRLASDARLFSMAKNMVQDVMAHQDFAQEKESVLSYMQKIYDEHLNHIALN